MSPNRAMHIATLFPKTTRFLNRTRFLDRTRSLAATLSLATAVLWDCASTPPPAESEALVEIPGSWSVDSEPTSPLSGPWWESFADADLDRIISEALEHNFDLRAAAAAMDSALAQARIAGAELKPQASVGGDASRRQQVFVGLPIPGTGGVLQSQSTSLGTSLNVSWEPDLWGRLRAGKAAALADAAAARADYEAARLSLAAQVAKAWFAVAEAGHQVRLADETVASRQSSTERIAARYRRGVAAALDLRLARSNQAEAESAVALRQRQLDLAQRQLETLAGRYPTGNIGDEAGEQALTLPDVPEPVPAGLPSELVARRPDLKAAERRLAAAGLRIREARRSLYPRVTLTASGGTTSDSLGDLLDSDFSVWGLASSLLQPIFQGGRLRAAVDFAESSRERALALYAQGVLRAFAEVESALAAERLLTLEETAQAAAARESTAAAKLAEDRYLAGLGDYLSILESQRRAFASESRVLSIRALLLTNRVDLHLALGGDFQHSPEASKSSSTDPR